MHAYARDREFGALKVIDAYFGYNSPPGVWRLKKSLAGGVPPMDVGIYALQATRYLTREEPTWVSAITTQGDPTRFLEVEESVFWETKFPAGSSVVVARVTARQAQGISVPG